MLNRNQWVKSITTLVLFCLSIAVQSKQNDVEKFSKIVSGMRTYQADFEQTVRDESGKKIDFSSGTITIQRPAHFRWEVKKEFPQLIVADGDYLWTYDIDLEQVTIQNQSAVMTNSPLMLLTSSIEELRAAFDFTLINTSGQPDSSLFILKPLSEEGAFDSVKVLVKKGKITELLMTDTLGQSTSVKFSAVKINQKINVALFRVDIPEGVDVVDSRGSVEK